MIRNVSDRPETLELLRKGHGVTRCHTASWLSPETVGHHSAGVAALVLLVYAPSLPPSKLLAAAIYHDLPEQYTGDLPAMVKWNHTELKEALSKVEKEFWDMTAFGIDPVHHLYEHEVAILKWCDITDLAFAFRDELWKGNSRALPDAMRCVQHLNKLAEGLTEYKGVHELTLYITMEIDHYVD